MFSYRIFTVIVTVLTIVVQEKSFRWVVGRREGEPKANIIETNLIYGQVSGPPGGFLPQIPDSPQRNSNDTRVRAEVIWFNTKQRHWEERKLTVLELMHSD